MEPKQPQTSFVIDSQVLLQTLLSFFFSYPTKFMQRQPNVPTGIKFNMSLGVGFCLHNNGLSCGLPVDVIRLILIAFVARHPIKVTNSEQECYLIIRE